MNENLPTFVVLITQGFGNMQALSARFWGSGFLPSEHQGCKLRSGGDPVLYLKDPDGLEFELYCETEEEGNEETLRRDLGA